MASSPTHVHSPHPASITTGGVRHGETPLQPRPSPTPTPPPVSEYHVGPFDPAAGAFDLAASGAPAKMDLGDVFYAPNVLTDKQVCQDSWSILYLSFLPL